MPLDWLLIWGVAQATGALVKPVLEDFAKDIVNDSAKDYVKDSFGKVFKPLQKDAHQKALGKALKELVELIDAELRNSGVAEAQTEAWVGDVKQFRRTESVQAALRQAFEASNSAVDGALLKEGWRQLPEISPLPPGFNWDYVAESFTRKLHSLRQQDSEWRQILLAQAAVETATHTRQALGAQPDFQLQKYREALLESYANLHFDTLDTSGANYSGVKLWSVFVPQTVRESSEFLPQLHEIPKEHLRRMVERGGLDAREAAHAKELIEERRRAYLDQSPRSVQGLIADDRLTRLVILGDPGAGKSSLLQHLALEWARTEIAAEREALLLPLLIEFKEYDCWDCSSGKSFVRYLHDAQNWHRLDQVKLDERLKDGKQSTLLLLDGLDEIFDPIRRAQVINDIHYFSNQYPQVRVIVTARVIGYKPQRLADAEFRHFMLQDLDQAQINDFLDRWHNTTYDARDREAKKARLARAISDSSAIRELAGNPLLLTMMAILNRNQELPRERIQLYEQASRLLLHQWDTERALDSHPLLKGHIGPKEKSEMLREIAYAMQSAPEGLAGNMINEDDLEAMLSRYLKKELGFGQPLAAVRDLIAQLRERNFILCFRGGGSYSFVHRTFLEYFCATAIHQRFVQKLDLEYLLHEIFALHWQDEKWHEVLCLVAGQVAESSVEHVAQIIEFLLKQQDKTFEFHYLFLASRCCQELRNPCKLGKTVENLRVVLESLLGFDFPYFYEPWEDEGRQRDRLLAKAVAALVNTQLLSQPVSWLKDHTAKDYHGAVRQAALQELARGWKGNPETLPLLKTCATQDDDWEVRESALRELARVWRDDPGTLPILKAQAMQDDDPNVRQAALDELVRGWRDDPETLLVLKARVMQDYDSDVQQAAMWELAHGWKDDPETLPLLKAYATQGDDSDVQRAALRELARGWKDDPETFPLLKTRATQDEDSEMRQTALEELARGWKGDPETLLILKIYATQDYDSNVQQTALRELARGWKDDPDTLPILRAQATQDHDSEVRQTALQELVRGWKDDPETLPGLKARAMQDGNSNVRQTALRELARGWRDDPETLPIIKTCIMQDSDSDVRKVAMHELARGWRDNPETLPFLKARAMHDDYSDVREAAWHVLARGWRGNFDILILLIELAGRGELWTEFLLDTMLSHFTKHRPEHPETLPLLHEGAQNDPAPRLLEKAKQLVAEIEARRK